MGIVIRQSIKSSAMSFLGIVIGAFTTLWLMPRFLTMEQKGVLDLLLALAVSIATFSHLGAANIADRFFPIFKNKAQKHHGYLVFLLTYAGLGFLLYASLYFIFKSFLLTIYTGEKAQINHYYYHVIIFTGIWVLTLIFEAYLRIHLRIAIPTFFREVLIRLITLGTIVVFALGFISFEQVVIIYILGFVVALSGLILYTKHLKILFVKTEFSFINKKLLKDITTYGSFLMIGGAGSIIISKIDVLMIPYFLGEGALGIYTISYYLGGVIEIPKKMISQISNPLISQAWADNNLRQIQEVYQKSALNQFLVGAFIFLGIWCNIDNIFAIIPQSETLKVGKYVVLFVGISKLIDMITGVNQEIISQSKYYKFNFVMMLLLAFLIIITNLIFIPWFGMTGAALATTLSFLIFNLIKFWFLWIKWKFQPFSLGMLKAFVVFGGILLLMYFLPQQESYFVDILIRSSIITFIFGVSTIGWKISSDINNIFTTTLKKLKK